jgi:hypothetical protein
MSAHVIGNGHPKSNSDGLLPDGVRSLATIFRFERFPVGASDGMFTGRTP